MEIRLAEEKDFDEIAYIERRCFNSDIAYSKEKLLEEYDFVKERFYVVLYHGTMVAYFWSERWKIKDYSVSRLFDIMKNTPHQKDGDVLYIGNVSVLPEWRGLGIGEKMMNHMLTDLPNVKYSVLAVPVESTSAIRLYERLGYKTAQVLSNYYAKNRMAKIMCVIGGKFLG